MESSAHDFDDGGSDMGGDERSDVWAGPRPVTGRLLAEQITTGKQPEVLRPFDPRRRAVA
ncbi:hypothetical protein [Mycobacterium sp. AT1]|uniref:hypothetical protein n=1 Tax=Mycobacterium sp. AT1 TaxID=1961706 RepID=UPI0009AC53D9|nr:hypothetical protein [Mycobacterium sp. AT1]OPX06095.1 hypothetical protein B1790_29120 [Mycobacterium sp. AT1]